MSRSIRPCGPLQLGYHPPRLFDAIAREALPRTFAFTTQELSGTLWALAKCRHSSRAVAPLLHVRISNCLPGGCLLACSLGCLFACHLSALAAGGMHLLWNLKRERLPQQGC